MNRVAKAVGACVMTLSSVPVFAQAPVASDVTMTQDPSRKVTVTYSLDRPAVVTLDIETNVTGSAEWVSIGGENIRGLVGDVNKLVRTSGSHTILWQPDQSWPNHRVPENGARAVVTAWAPDAPPDWMLIDLSSPSNVAYYASVGQLPYGHPTNTYYKTKAILMRKIPAADRTFRMGISYGESNMDFLLGGKYSSAGRLIYLKDYAPARLVSFTEDFYMSIYQLTQSQYTNVTTMTRALPAHDGRKYEPYGECPVTGFSYNNLRGTATSDHYDWPKHGHEIDPSSVFGQFCAYTGVAVDLPTEAQWEYACRAGEGRYRYDGAPTCDAHDSERICWNVAYGKSAITNPQTGNEVFEFPVGRKDPNAWGLYDFYGNGYQLCLDYYVSGYANCGTVDPTGPQQESGTNGRTLRGSLASADIRFAASALRGIELRRSDFAHVYISTRMVAPALAK